MNRAKNSCASSALLAVAFIALGCTAPPRAATPSPTAAATTVLETVPVATTPEPTPQPTRPPYPYAPTPLPMPTRLYGHPEAERYRKLAARVAPCSVAEAESTIDGRIYIGCAPGTIVALDANHHVLGTTTLQLSGITRIMPAGAHSIAIKGFASGGMMVSRVSFLDARTLEPLLRERLDDSTYLGTIGERAYVDDWCCFGRSDVYEPATIYSISLRDGTKTDEIDLTPDPKAHPAFDQPRGQGENNYMIPPYFYVVVGDDTYRYDVRNLSLPPKHFSTSLYRH